MRARIVTFSIMVVFVVVSASFAQNGSSGERFHQVIRTNDLGALRALVAKHGVDAKDSFGLTPLMLATAFGTRDAVTLVVDAGADVNVASNAGLTALHMAWRDEAVVRLLLERGARIDAKTLLGVTPLLAAAEANGTSAVASLLLDRGADPNAADSRGVSPLIAAATVGNASTAKLLLARGADPAAYVPTPGPKIATALMGAAQWRRRTHTPAARAEARR